MIEVINVTKEYIVNKKKKTVFKSLDDVNISIAENSSLGIIGQSGAGKSTLIRMINGLVTPSSGKILVDNFDIGQLKQNELRKLRKKIGMVFQSFNLLSSLTVYDNVKLSLDIGGYPNEDKDKRIKEVLSLVHIDSKSNQYPSKLSGGEKQRVAIARAIANNPKYLLCDEITSALDHNTALEIVDLLKSIKKHTNMTIIFITHQIHIARKLCSNLILMENGKIIEENSTKELFINPMKDETKTLINSILELPQITKDDTYRLIYNNNHVSEDILSQIVKKYDVSTNIIDAKTVDILDEQIGYLTISINGQDKLLAINELKSKNIEVRTC